MNMEWIDLFENVGLFGIASGFITWMLNKSSDRKIELYKAQLELESKNFQLTLDSKLEIHKTELGIQSYKSTKVYEQQLASLVELYKLLSDLNFKMVGLTRTFKQIITDFNTEEQERIKQAAEAGFDFQECYRKNKIFFPKNLTDKIDQIQSEYLTSYNQHVIAYQMGDGDKKFLMDEIKKVNETVSNVIQPMVEEIITDFRILIGVQEN